LPEKSIIDAPAGQQPTVPVQPLPRPAPETLHHGFEAPLDIVAADGMGEDVEPAGLDRVQHQSCDLGRIEAVGQRLGIAPVALGITAAEVERNRSAETRRTIAAVVQHAGLDPAWTKHADAA
jgi:hypothetical protein